MKGLVIRWLVLTVAILCASYLIDGIRVEGIFNAFFAAAILGIMTLHVMAINSNNRSRDIMSGSTILADQFEKLISMAYDSPDLVPGATASGEMHGYRIERIVSTTLIPNVKKIEISVIRDVENGRRFEATYYKGNRH